MFGDRKTALKEIMQLHERQHTATEDCEEETIALIMQRIELRQKKRTSREYAEMERDIVDRPVDIEEEEL
jgi:hypothetical protein